jgi:hypothetical protein
MSYPSLVALEDLQISHTQAFGFTHNTGHFALTR